MQRNFILMALFAIFSVSSVSYGSLKSNSEANFFLCVIKNSEDRTIGWDRCEKNKRRYCLSIDFYHTDPGTLIGVPAANESMAKVQALAICKKMGGEPNFY